MIPTDLLTFVFFRGVETTNQILVGDLIEQMMEIIYKWRYTAMGIWWEYYNQQRDMCEY